MAKKKIETTSEESGVVDTKLKSKAEIQDSLSFSIADSLNKLFSKDYEKVAYYLDGSEEVPSDLNDWVSVGSDIADIAISNRPNGGLPSGRIVEIAGWESGGKSLLCAHIMADTQRKGGLPVYIETENSVDKTFFTSIGIDLNPKKFLYVPLSLTEEIFGAIENIVTKARESKNKRLLTIVVDSISAASTEVEMESGFGKDGFATAKALIMSKGMRKIKQLIAKENILLIFTSQLRDKVGVTFGEKSVSSSGGHALKFYSSIRLKVAAIGQLKVGEDNVGVATEVTVVKNKIGPPKRKVKFDIYYNSGIDNLGSWLNVMKERKIANTSGANYTWVDKETAEELTFTKKTFKSLLKERPEIKKSIYKDICDSMIMEYKRNDSAEADDIQEPLYDSDTVSIDTDTKDDE